MRPPCAPGASEQQHRARKRGACERRRRERTSDLCQGEKEPRKEKEKNRVGFFFMTHIRVCATDPRRSGHVTKTSEMVTNLEAQQDSLFRFRGLKSGLSDGCKSDA